MSLRINYGESPYPQAASKFFAAKVAKASGLVTDSKWKSDKEMIYFLYGTLQEGNRLHYLLDRKYKSLEFKPGVIQGYKLVEVAPGVPGIIRSAYHSVYGEVWKLKNHNIDIINAIEKDYEQTAVVVQTNYGDAYATAFVWPADKPFRKELSVNQWTLDIEKQSYNDYPISANPSPYPVGDTLSWYDEFDSEEIDNDF